VYDIIEPYLIGAVGLGMVLAMLWGAIFVATKLIDLITGDDNV
jgi:hypothetical protein